MQNRISHYVNQLIEWLRNRYRSEGVFQNYTNVRPFINLCLFKLVSLNQVLEVTSGILIIGLQLDRLCEWFKRGQPCPTAVSFVVKGG